jgi:hypothetical protein
MRIMTIRTNQPRISVSPAPALFDSQSRKTDGMNVIKLGNIPVRAVTRSTKIEQLRGGEGAGLKINPGVVTPDFAIAT